MKSKTYIKKVCSTLLLSSMVAALLPLGGCALKKASSDKDVPMGRYVEEKIDLPKEFKNRTLFQLDANKDELPVIYSEDPQKNGMRISTNTLTKDGKWNEQPLDWIGTLPQTKIYGEHYLTDGNGAQYFYYLGLVEGTEDNYKCYLLKQVDGKAKDITPKDWNQYHEEDKYYTTPSFVGVLENGTIAASYEDSSYFYDSKTMKATEVSQLHSQCSEILGNKFIQYQQEDQQKFTGFSVTDCSNSSFDAPDTYTLPSNSDMPPTIKTNKTGDYLMMDSDGIHLLQKDTNTWQTLLDGSLTSLYVGSFYLQDFYETSQKDFYALCGAPGGSVLLKYHYDSSIASVPDTELTIYGLHDDTTIRQAIVEFQGKNPEVRVVFHIAMDEDSKENPEDFIRALNTQLLAKEGDDLLLLDGLPIASYVQKKVLVDLTDLLDPLVSDGTLLKNVLANYKLDGHYYYAPAKFGLNLAFGHEASDLDGGKDLSSLAALAKTCDRKERSVMGSFTPEDLIKTFLPASYSSIVPDRTTIDKAKLTDFLTQIKQIYDACPPVKDPDRYYEPSIYQLPSQYHLLLKTINGLEDSNFELAVADYLGTSFVNYNQSFSPLCEIGINQASKQKKLAKEFLKTIYSKEVQEIDCWNGFSTNTAALESLKDQITEPAFTEIPDENGKSIPFAIKDPTKEQKKHLIELCKQTTTPAFTEPAILTAVQKEAAPYLSGECSVDDAVNKIMSQLQTYLNEQQ